MQVHVADSGHLRKQLTINYSSDEVQARRHQVLRQLSGEVRLNGFRPGKSSTAVVEKRFGATATSRAEEQLLDEGVNKALKEHSLKPVGPISNDEIARAGGLTLKMSFDIKPAITLPEPKSMGLVEPAITVADAEVDERLMRFRRRLGTMSPLADSETLIEDDSMVVDGRVLVDGASIKELKGFQHMVGTIPLFGAPPESVIAAVAGKKAGDSIVLDGTVPASFTPPEHAGKPARLELTIVTAQRLREAPLDEVIKRMGVEDEPKVRDLLRTQLARGRENEARQTLIQSMMEKLLESVPVEVPAKFLENATTSSVAEAVKRAEAEGKSGEDLEKVRTEAAASIGKSVRRYLIVDAIIESRRISVTRQDLEQQITMAAMQSNRPPEEVAKRLQESGQINQVLQEIREAKAIETFLDEALGKPVEANPGHGEIGHVHGPDCGH